MIPIRKRLTYANVMSSIAVFLVLGGATAFAASQLGKNSVGTKQLKKNAVTGVKIKNGAVTGAKLANGAVSEGKLGTEAVTEAKIKNGAVTGGKLADGSVSSGKIQNGAVTGDKLAAGAVTGSSINAGSTPFTQVTGRLRYGSTVNLQGSGATLIGAYNQPPNEDDIYLGGVSVTFESTCTGSRTAVAFLLLDSTVPTAESIIGYGIVTDSSGGNVTKRLEFGDYGITGSGGMQRMGTSVTQTHAFYIYPAGSSCGAGSGISGSDLGVDVLGTK